MDKVYLDNIDIKYRDFSKKLVFTKYEILGIRLPILRKIAKDIYKGDYITYLDNFNGDTFEEIMVYGFIISYITDINLYLKYIDKYVSLIDNWSLCDSFVSSSKLIKNNKEKILKLVKKYVNKKKTYYKRIGLVILLEYYVEDSYLEEIFNICSNIDSDEYYVEMALAWLLSVCYIRYPKTTFKYLKENKINNETLKMTIRKIKDSYRVSIEDKEKLSKLRV